MSLFGIILSPYRLVTLIAAYYLLSYLARWRWLTIPSPFPAAFTNFWLLYQCRRGKRYIAVHLAHEKYGKIVRIQPHHVSIADVEAIQAIYGHGNGFLKSEYYDAFASNHRSLFNTRDRAEHTRKRKAVSHTFSSKSISQFEQYIQNNIGSFVNKWNSLCEHRTDSHIEYVSINALHWFNYLAFDIIGDLAFGAPFGMVSRGEDLAEVRKTPSSPPTYAPAIEVLNRQGEVSATLGCYPYIKSFSKYIPDSFFWYGLKAVSNMSGIAVERVTRRLQADVMSKNTRMDLLARLLESKDETGKPLSPEELTTEALTFLVAGSNTTSITACALLYWTLITPGVMRKLQRAIDAVVTPGANIPPFNLLKDVQYLQWVIWETMRIHSTLSLGLPRQIPPGSTPVTICGTTFYPGDVVSVPTYTIHHSKEIWGPDADLFVPERWDPVCVTALQKAAFIPFSTGPRACIGRNLAEMELTCIVGTIFRNFEFRVEQDTLMETKEGFLRKPSGLMVGLKIRHVK